MQRLFVEKCQVDFFGRSLTPMASVKGLVTRVPGIQRRNLQKDKPRISTKGRITWSTKCYSNYA